MRPIYGATKLIDPDSLKESIFYLFKKAAEAKKARNGRLRIKTIRVKKYTEPKVSFEAEVIFDYKGRRNWINLYDVPDSQIIPEDYWVGKNKGYLESLISKLVDDQEVSSVIDAVFEQFCNTVSSNSNLLNYRFIKDNDRNTDYSDPDGWIEFLAVPESINNPEFTFELLPPSSEYDAIGDTWVLKDNISGLSVDDDDTDTFLGITYTVDFGDLYTENNFSSTIREVKQEEERIQDLIDKFLYFRTFRHNDTISELLEYASNNYPKFNANLSWNEEFINRIETGEASVADINDLSVEVEITLKDTDSLEGNMECSDYIYIYNHSIEQILDEFEDILERFKNRVDYAVMRRKELESSQKKVNKTPNINTDEQRRREAYKEKYKNRKNKYEPTIYEDDSFDWDGEGNLI